MGVFLRRPRPLSGYRSLPHARGGVSSFHSLHFFSGWSSPRTWGCFSDIRPRESNRVVFPTHVGVFLPDTSPYWSCSGSSPRTWGCFWCAKILSNLREVFPTHVGVFLYASNSLSLRLCLPHARGGVSSGASFPLPSKGSSPRTWGCFYRRGQREKMGRVFPTHVGVFHARGGLVRFWHCLPHARGGAPSRGCPPKAPSSRLGLFTSTLDIDSFIWREWQKGRRTCLNIF